MQVGNTRFSGPAAVTSKPAEIRQKAGPRAVLNGQRKSAL
jgi:hypothetical protein